MPVTAAAAAACRSRGSRQLPVLDLVAPRPTTCRAYHSKARISTAATTDSGACSQATTPPPPHDAGLATARRPLTAEQQRFLDSALRVNQAGELAAVLIYMAQTPPIVRAHPHLRPLMKHMQDQEDGHFRTFNTLLAKHRIRPTAMYPIWKVAASVLGWSTAVIGREAAMACTEAVETEIGGHYNEQISVLLEWARELERKGEKMPEEIDVLLADLRRIRDEELEHLDHALENDAKEAKPYELLTNVIRGGCRAAIWISERV